MNVEDGPAAAFQHVRHGELGDEEDPTRVDAMMRSQTSTGVSSKVVSAVVRHGAFPGAASLRIVLTGLIARVVHSND